MSFISSIVGGFLGAHGATEASNAEQTGAQKAQALEKENQTNAVTAQNTALSNVTAAEQPYQNLGGTSANHLVDLLGKGFQAPTLAEAEQTPGFQFNLEQGSRAIAQNAAATGNLMSGNTGVALEKYGQNLAEGTYQQDYQNALDTYNANVNPLLSATGIGLNSTGQLSNANLTTAGNTANIDLTSGEQQAQQINNAAAARASGYLGRANAWSGAIGGALGSKAGQWAGSQLLGAALV